MNYTYIVQCSDSTYYTGWTNHLEARIQAHNAGKGAKYTKARRPLKLVYYETFETKSEALSREYQIKQLSRQEYKLRHKIQNMIRNNMNWSIFSFAKICAT